MRYLRIGIIIGLILQFLVGCNKDVSGDEKTAEQYVKEHGYKITSYKGEVYSYTLEKSKLTGDMESISLQQTWGVQKEAPDKYFGKLVTIYGFIVPNHPLEKIYNVKTNVYIMISEGNVIGAYSFPDAEMFGAPYSLDGKTLEEVSGLSYQEWRDIWIKKYGTNGKR